MDFGPIKSYRAVLGVMKCYRAVFGVIKSYRAVFGVMKFFGTICGVMKIFQPSTWCHCKGVVKAMRFSGLRNGAM